MTRKARSSATSPIRSAGSNSRQSTICGGSDRMTCSARRSPWPSRTRPRAARRASAGVQPPRNGTRNRRSAMRRAPSTAPGCASRSSRVVRTARPRGPGSRRARRADGARRGGSRRAGARAAPRRRRSPCRRPTGRERVRLGEAAHLDRHLEDAVVVDAAIPVGDEREAVRGTDQRERPEIDAGREPPVQADLLAAQGAPALERAVVEESEGHRLLDLVRAVPGQEDPRAVRLDDLDRRRRARVCPRVAHRRHDERGVIADGGRRHGSARGVARVRDGVAAAPSSTRTGTTSADGRTSGVRGAPARSARYDDR